MYKQKQVGPFFHHKCTRQATQPRGRLSPGHRDRQLSPEVASAPRSPQPRGRLSPRHSYDTPHMPWNTATPQSLQAIVTRLGATSLFLCVFFYTLQSPEKLKHCTVLAINSLIVQYDETDEAWLKLAVMKETCLPLPTLWSLHTAQAALGHWNRHTHLHYTAHEN